MYQEPSATEDEEKINKEGSDDETDKVDTEVAELQVGIVIILKLKLDTHLCYRLVLFTY